MSVTRNASQVQADFWASDDSTRRSSSAQGPARSAVLGQHERPAGLAAGRGGLGIVEVF